MLVLFDDVICHQHCHQIKIGNRTIIKFAGHELVTILRATRMQINRLELDFAS